MSIDPVERLLAEDFAKARKQLENDGFAEATLARLSASRRRRLAAVGVAGGLGALLAGAQFMKLAGLFAPAAALLESATIAGTAAPAYAAAGLSGQLLAAAAIAVAFAATALVAQGER